LSSICKKTRIVGWREDNWELWKRSKHDVVVVVVNVKPKFWSWRLKIRMNEVENENWKFETEKVFSIQWGVETGTLDGHGSDGDRIVILRNQKVTPVLFHVRQLLQK
jgi:uncharacterized protein (UPF0548 family)